MRILRGNQAAERSLSISVVPVVIGKTHAKPSSLKVFGGLIK